MPPLRPAPLAPQCTGKGMRGFKGSCVKGEYEENFSICMPLAPWEKDRPAGKAP